MVTFVVSNHETVEAKKITVTFSILAVVYGVVIIGGAFVVKYFGTLVLQVYNRSVADSLSSCN